MFSPEEMDRYKYERLYIGVHMHLPLIFVLGFLDDRVLSPRKCATFRGGYPAASSQNGGHTV